MTGDLELHLGIDFGTTHTVAALRGRGGQAQPLMFDGGFLLPSAVFAETDGRLLTGRDAERSARLDPARFEPTPKRRIDDGAVLLGVREYPVIDLIAATLRRAIDEAARVAGRMPDRIVLTHPANWAARRRSVLLEAAARAGIPPVELVAEPIAAALYFTDVLRQSLPPGTALVVYDFGGGTFDTTALWAEPQGGWAVLASDGLPDLGGVDLDAAIVEYLRRSVGASDEEGWRRLVQPADDRARKRNRMLWDDVRAAKEQLSRVSSTLIHIPLLDVDAYLTREEFERIARPYVERTTDVTATTLQRAGLRADQVGGLFLVGGSSRIPLVSTLLHHRLGVAPTVVEQPELAVALGSLLALRDPVSGPPSGPAPAVPPSAPQYVPSAAVPAPASPAAAAAGGLPPRRTAGRSRRPALIVTAVSAVLVLVAVVLGYQLWGGNGSLDQGSDNGSGSGNSEGSVGSTAQAKPGASKQQATINKAVWYGALKLTFETVRYDRAATPALTVEVLVENLGADGTRPSVPMTFSIDGRSNSVQSDQSGAVAGGQKSRVTYEASNVELKGSLADGVFRVGDGDEAQAVVPVGRGTLVAYRPKAVLANTTVVFRDLKIRFIKCELRGGFFDFHGQVDKGHWGLDCILDAQYTGDSAGGHYFGDENVRLGLPDGTEIGSTVSVNEALYGAAVHPDVEAGFMIRTPVQGRYLLRIVDVHSGESRSASSVHEIPITLDAA